MGLSALFRRSEKQPSQPPIPSQSRLLPPSQKFHHALHQRPQPFPLVEITNQTVNRPVPADAPKKRRPTASRPKTSRGFLSDNKENVDPNLLMPHRDTSGAFRRSNETQNKQDKASAFIPLQHNVGITALTNPCSSSLAPLSMNVASIYFSFIPHHSA